MVVIKEAPRTARRNVLCRCDCGRERTVQVNNLTSGNTKSCGHVPCCRRWDWRRLPPGEQARTVIFLNYQSVARNKGRVWEITREQFDSLTAAPCHYCGAPPSNRTRDRWGDGAFVYSGLDRVDPARGYTLDNVVPACIICNRAKTNLSLEEFRDWVERVASVLIERRR